MSGDARAMAMMGAFYQSGNGVKPDLEKAVSWFTKAAEKNHPGAQFSLAMLYLDGSLGNPDADTGAKWLEKAAPGGNPQAQYNLGLLYTGVYGTPPAMAESRRMVQEIGRSGLRRSAI